MNETIQVVIVLYNMTVEQSNACQFFLTQPFSKHIQLLIYDHTKQAQTHPFFEHPQVTYQHDPRNLGLAVAYNQAFRQGKARCRWLLLLDQDTTCTMEYLTYLLTQPKTNVACVVPKVMDHHQISPVLAQGYVDHTAQFPAVGVTKKRIMAINSGTCWSMAFLDQIGGFNEDFPLDFLDHWLFFEVFQQNQAVDVTDFTLQHRLSVLDYETLPEARYRSILASEALYYSRYEIDLKRRHQKQLVLRTLKQLLTVKNRAIWKLTWREFNRFRKEGRG
ncbi:glycosyltransferase [uncultured Enterococcus sp.]|uniref:glycosyltransferase n=1 Tax=uncultured Enterococcus sp. TaxID=167972 RepID=UPI0025FAC697|nr:glycosyltransferase [uncultured Enterococcus sp.]